MPDETKHRVSLLDIVTRGDFTRITESGALRRFRPTGLDEQILSIADAAISRRVPTGLVLPVGGTNAGIILCAAILVAHVARTKKLAAQIAFMTKQLRLRSFYDSLHFRNQRVAEYFPRTLITADGTATDVGHRPLEFVGKTGRLHFATSVRSLGLFGHPLHGIVIEGHPDFEEAVPSLIRDASPHIPILYLASDPADPVLDDLAVLGAVWGWDGASLRELVSTLPNSDFICEAPETLRATAFASYEISCPPQATDIDSALATLWDDLVALQHHPGGVTYEAVGWVWGVFGSLSHLLSPVETYDRYARGAWGTTPLIEAAMRAEAYARNVLNQDDREYWQLLAEDLDTAVRAAASTNPKPRAVAEWVRRVVAKNAQGLVVIKNRAGRQALTHYLQERTEIQIGWDSNIRIATFSELLNGKAKLITGETLFAGPVTSTYAGLLALPSSTCLTILGHGPWESSRILRQVSAAARKLDEIVRGPLRNHAELRLFTRSQAGRQVPGIPPTIRTTGLTSPTNIPPSSQRAVWNPFDLRVASAISRSEVESEGPDITMTSETTGTLDVIVIEFSDAIGLFEPSHPVSRLRDGEIHEVAAKSIIAGDRVVLIEGGARRDLFDVIVGKLERLPEFEATVMLIREWHERAARAGHECRLTPYQILQRMGPSAHITSPQAIVTWIRGFVHGPLHAEDIREFGSAVGDRFLVDRWEAVGRALATFRAHRRRVGHMLGRVLSGIKPGELEDSGYFDRRLGIHYSDLTEALSVHVARIVAKEVRSAGFQYANRLLTSEETDKLDLIARPATK